MLGNLGLNFQGLVFIAATILNGSIASSTLILAEVYSQDNLEMKL